MLNFEIEIVRSKSSEVDEFAHLFDQYRQFYGQISNTQSARDFLWRRLEADESTVFVAYANGERHEAVGFLQLYPSYSSISLGKAWILNDLFVAEGYRGHSVAKFLLNEATAFARKHGVQELTLKTATNNLAAQRLYEALGWQKDSQFLSYDLNCRSSDS